MTSMTLHWNSRNQCDYGSWCQDTSQIHQCTVMYEASSPGREEARFPWEEEPTIDQLVFLISCIGESLIAYANQLAVVLDSLQIHLPKQKWNVFRSSLHLLYLQKPIAGTVKPYECWQKWDIAVKALISLCVLSNCSCWRSMYSNLREGMALASLSWPQIWLSIEIMNPLDVLILVHLKRIEENMYEARTAWTSVCCRSHWRCKTLGFWVKTRQQYASHKHSIGAHSTWLWMSQPVNKIILAKFNSPSVYICFELETNLLLLLA